MTRPVWIGLGSNLGDRKAILDAAVATLADAPGVAVEAVSSYLETRPIGGPPGQGPFLNAAARLATTLSPPELLATTRGIEDRFGRRRAVRWGERTLDIDLLIFDGREFDSPELKLPHPRLAFRRFVLRPLAEIAAEVVDPASRRTISDLLANLDRKPRLLAIAGPPGPRKATVFRRLVESLPAIGLGAGDEPGDPLIWISRKGEVLPVGRWADDLEVPWIVSDRCPPVDPNRASTTADRGGGFDSVKFSGIPTDLEQSHLARLVSRVAIPPTIVAVLPQRGGTHGTREVHQAPSLRTEAEEPEAIVAEILTICRGIEDM